MNQPSGHNEWDQLPGPMPSVGVTPPLRAAILLWIVGPLQMAIFGCCGSVYATMAMIPYEEFLKLFEQHQPHMADQADQIHPLLPAFAVSMLVLGFLPGVAYLLLGFGVRKAKPAAINFAQMIALTQGIVLAVFFLLLLAGAVQTGSPMTLTFVLILIGTPLAILGVAFYWLQKAKRYRDDVLSADDDPWNNP